MIGKPEDEWRTEQAAKQVAERQRQAEEAWVHREGVLLPAHHPCHQR